MKNYCSNSFKDSGKNNDKSAFLDLFLTATAYLINLRLDLK
jgi:hypothetical protein